MRSRWAVRFVYQAEANRVEAISQAFNEYSVGVLGMLDAFRSQV